MSNWGNTVRVILIGMISAPAAAIESQRWRGFDWVFHSTGVCFQMSNLLLFFILIALLLLLPYAMYIIQEIIKDYDD